MRLTFVQSENALCPMVLIEAGTVISVKLEQPEKAYAPISFIAESVS